VAVVPDASLLIKQAPPSVQLSLNGEPIGELLVASRYGRGLWSGGVNGGCHCLFVGISWGCVKNYLSSCSTMQRVAPAPTISPMMYAIRILVIWFGFLSG